MLKQTHLNIFPHLWTIQIASGKTYKELVIERILHPLKMTNSAPNKESENEDYPYEHVYQNLAALYYLDNNYQLKKQDTGMVFLWLAGWLSLWRTWPKRLVNIPVTENRSLP